MTTTSNNDDDSSLEEDATSPIKLSLNASIAEHTRRLRTYALSSLSNALALLYSENILCDTISASSKEWYASVLIPRLIDNVKCYGTIKITFSLIIYPIFGIEK